jgi:putative hemolysin
MTDVFVALNLPLPADVPPTQTVAQWVNVQLGRTPTKNEKINAAGLILETRKFRRHKLVEALVTKAEK